MLIVLFSLDDKCPPRTETRNTPFLRPVSCFPILKMMIGRVLLRWGELLYPAFNFGRKNAPSRKRHSGLNPSVVRHRKRLHPLATGSVSRARASTLVGEQDRTDSGRIASITISVRIRIDDR